MLPIFQIQAIKAVLAIMKRKAKLFLPAQRHVQSFFYAQVMDGLTSSPSTVACEKRYLRVECRARHRCLFFQHEVVVCGT